MLTLRAPNALDLPPLYVLATDNATKFLDDYSVFDIEYAKAVLNGETVIIDDAGYAAGVVWFNDQLDDLHTQMHVLVKPEYWKQVIKHEIIPKAVDWAFEHLKVNKIIAEPMSTQKGAIKLLRKYKFYEHKPFYKHSKQGGVIVDVIRFEARKNYWRKLRDGIRQQSELQQR